MAETKEPVGRLELTWTNKARTLLTQEDGTYEWVEPGDRRVSEVRLLQDVATVGDISSKRSADNLLIRGDALHALQALNRIPEFAREYLGKVRLVYIDPPFNTGQAFTQYDDALEHSVWLTMLRDRLAQIKPLLAPDGTVWVHLDDTEAHRARVVLDEMFGPENFIAVVVWEKSDSPRMDAQTFSTRHDMILVYGVSDQRRIRRLTEVRPSHYNRQDEHGEWYYTKPLRAMGGQGDSRAARPNLYYPLSAPDGTQVYPRKSDGSDGAWRWSPGKVEAEGHRIEWVKTAGGWSPYFRIYFGDRGRPPETIWLHGEVGSNRTSKNEIRRLFPDAEPFATPKPERLMQRIIDLATEPGEVVLDCFAGSGTTAAVAHKMGRRWVTVESSPETVATFTLPRLQMVTDGSDTGGISTVEVPTGDGLPEDLPSGSAKSAARTLKALGDAGHLDSFDSDEIKELLKYLRSVERTTTETMWSGGGGFRVLDVGPTMFQEVDGRIYLAEWATNGALGEATAAQLGYEYAQDPPFCGTKGKVRLAVVDGLVNEGVIRLLVDALPPGQRICVCGTAIDPDARPVLRELAPGSTMKKVPAALLDEYRAPRRERLALANLLDWSEALSLTDVDEPEPVEA